MNIPSFSDHDGAASSDPLERQVWASLRRLTSAEATVDELRAFEAWVEADPAHRAAYRKVKAVWDALKPSTGQVAQARPGVVADYVRAQRGRQRTRRAVLGFAAVSVASAGIAVLRPSLGMWAAPAEWGADYRTETGEQRTLALADGVEVMLNTRTSVRRETTDGRTVGLDLLAGETAVDLQGGRRFTVNAGVGRSTADTGRLEVRYLDDKVCVTCIAGAVEVRHPSATRRLEAGQQTVYNDASISGVAQIDPDAVSAWRRGLLIFHKTRLADAISEINRYWPGRIVLTNSEIGERQVSGTFQIASPDQAIAQLQYMFGLRSRSLGGVVILS